jgi:valyl-tRNA synthetase
MLHEHSPDAVRYWAASARPGTDTAFDVAQMKVGRRLAIKLLNASKFALGFGVDPDTGEVTRLGAEAVTEALDRSMLAGLADLVDDATAAFEDVDYARALERTEAFFWAFCDDYLELVKARAYGGEHPEAATASARAALELALSTLHRLFAPFLPFTAEEVWSWWMEGSVHRARWPEAAPLREAADGEATEALAVAGSVLGALRGAKSAAKVSMRNPVASAVVTDAPGRLELLERVKGDVCDAGRVAGLELRPGDAFAVEVTLAPAD